MDYSDLVSNIYKFLSFSLRLSKSSFANFTPYRLSVCNLGLVILILLIVITCPTFIVEPNFNLLIAFKCLSIRASCIFISLTLLALTFILF